MFPISLLKFIVNGKQIIVSLDFLNLINLIYCVLFMRKEYTLFNCSFIHSENVSNINKSQMCYYVQRTHCILRT
jgi:hypothetical protein